MMTHVRLIKFRSSSCPRASSIGPEATFYFFSAAYRSWERARDLARVMLYTSCTSASSSLSLPRSLRACTEESIESRGGTARAQRGTDIVCHRDNLRPAQFAKDEKESELEREKRWREKINVSLLLMLLLMQYTLAVLTATSNGGGVWSTEDDAKSSAV